VSPSRRRRLASCSQAARNRTGSVSRRSRGRRRAGHAAAVFDGLKLAGVAGQDDLGAAGGGVGDQVGQVRAGDHRGLVDDQQGARADGDRAAGTAAAGQVTQELSRVVGHRDPGRQGIACRLRRGDADHRPQARGGPGARGLGQHAGLAGPFSELRGRDAGAQPGRRGEDALLSALPELEVIMGCCPAGWGRSPVGAAA
jgi:hypothetical protein